MSGLNILDLGGTIRGTDSCKGGLSLEEGAVAGVQARRGQEPRTQKAQTGLARGFPERQDLPVALTRGRLPHQLLGPSPGPPRGRLLRREEAKGKVTVPAFPGEYLVPLQPHPHLLPTPAGACAKRV